jgi:hypothetical protein
MSTSDQRAARSGGRRALLLAAARRSKGLRLVLKYLRSHDRRSRHTHNTAPTRLVEGNGIRFAYRRFGHLIEEALA